MIFCGYCKIAKGQIEWHHPVSNRPDVGIYLCQRHHSLIQGRKHPYLDEAEIEETRQKVLALAEKEVRMAGLNPDFDIDKR